VSEEENSYFILPNGVQVIQGLIPRGSAAVRDERSEFLMVQGSALGVNTLYYEATENIDSAITREKVLKKWNREWKLKLIGKSNPYWKDLSNEI